MKRFPCIADAGTIVPVKSSTCNIRHSLEQRRQGILLQREEELREAIRQGASTHSCQRRLSAFAAPKLAVGKALEFALTQKRLKGAAVGAELETLKRDTTRWEICFPKRSSSFIELERYERFEIRAGVSIAWSFLPKRPNALGAKGQRTQSKIDASG